MAEFFKYEIWIDERYGSKMRSLLSLYKRSKIRRKTNHIIFNFNFLSFNRIHLYIGTGTKLNKLNYILYYYILNSIYLIALLIFL